MIFKKVGFAGALLAIVLVLSNSASAFVMNYGDFPGATVTYLQVIESNNDVVAYFGSPDVIGDTLDFDPINFGVASSGVQGSQSKDGQLNFTVMGLGSNGITTLRIQEAGDFTIDTLPGQTATARVAATVNVSITHANGLPLPAPCTVNGMQLVFVPTGSGGSAVGGSYASPLDNGAAVPFSGLLNINVAGMLAACGNTGLATKVEIALDNALTANSANGGSAIIKKKDFGGVTITIPEPASISSIFSLVAGSALLFRRRAR
jgi:hypothetical protein